MKSFLPSIRTILLLAAAGLLLSSCVNDDLTECPPAENVRLRILTDQDARANATRAFDRYNIDSVLVFLFGADGRFLDVRTGGAYPSGKGYVVPMQLSPGVYHFAAVTNPGAGSDMDCTFEQLFSERPVYQEVTMCLTMPEGDCFTTPLPDLHTGMLCDAIVEESGVHEFTVVIEPHTYKVNFTLLGLPEEQYDLTVTADDFIRNLEDLKEWTGKEFDYARTALLTEQEPFNEHQTSMTLYNLTGESAQVSTTARMPFSITDATGKSVYDDCLCTMIELAYDQSPTGTVDYAAIGEFDITIDFTNKSQVTITVNGWTYVVDDMILDL